MASFRFSVHVAFSLIILGASVQLLAQESRTITPGQFHALTVPQGMTRMHIGEDYYSEDFSYEGETVAGAFRDFEAAEYFDLTTTVVLKYGLTDHVEIGVGVPFVASTFEKNTRDRSGLPSKITDRGLGNVFLHGGYGFAWNDESDYLLFQFDLGLPTDTRSEDLFSSGGNIVGSIEFEHYWNRFGITAGFLAESYADDGLDFEDWVYTGIVGINLDVTDRLFLGARVGFSSDDRVNVEIFGEHLLTHHSSLEVYVGEDVSGDTDARFIGVSLNFLFGDP